MKNTFRLVQLSAVIAAVLAAASTQAAMTDIRWSPSDTFDSILIVAPGKSAEVCGEIDPRYPVQWKYAADGPLNFNIHRHSGDTVIHANKSMMTREERGTLSPTFKFEWCWMWTNESATDVSVRVDLKR